MVSVKHFTSWQNVFFEQLPFDEMEFCAKQNGIEEAEKFIRDWMKE